MSNISSLDDVGRDRRPRAFHPGVEDGAAAIPREAGRAARVGAGRGARGPRRGRVDPSEAAPARQAPLRAVTDVRSWSALATAAFFWSPAVDLVLPLAGLSDANVQAPQADLC